MNSLFTKRGRSGLYSTVLTFQQPVRQGALAEDPNPANANATMKPQIKIIKKEDRNVAPSPVEAEVSVDPQEWSTTVKSWVKKFQKDRREGALETSDDKLVPPTS